MPRSTRRVAFVDSGLGLLGYADALHALRPDLGLVLSLDPDNMPYGPRTPGRGAAAHPRLGARHPPVRAGRHRRRVQHRLGPRPRRPACRARAGRARHRHRAGHPPGGRGRRAGRHVVHRGDDVERLPPWASSTPSPPTSRRMPWRRSASPRPSSPGTARRVDECIAYAASQTPAGVRSLVLGCTHYGLVVDRIVAALGPRA